MGRGGLVYLRIGGVVRVGGNSFDIRVRTRGYRNYEVF